MQLKKISFCSSFKFAIVLVCVPQKNTLQENGPSAAILRYLSMTKFPWKLKYMAKYILKAFFLTTFSSTKNKCPKIYAVTLVLPLNWSTQMFSRWCLIAKCIKFWLEVDTHIFLYNHSEASVKFVDFANWNLTWMVSKRSWNVAGQYSISITAYKMFITETDTTPLVLILPYVSKFKIKIRNENQNI